jgi:hypothetical protein
MTRRSSKRRIQANPLGESGLPRGFLWPKEAPVYHATTALRAIVRDGFKTRRELGGANMLGGGTDTAISFTLDLRTAESIAIGLRTIRRITLGEIGLGDLIIQAAEVAPQALAKARKDIQLNTGASTPEEVVLFDRGMRKIRWYASPTGDHMALGELSTEWLTKVVSDGLVTSVAGERDPRGRSQTGWIEAALLAEGKNEHDRENHERHFPGTPFDDRELRNWEKYGRFNPLTFSAYKALLNAGNWSDDGKEELYNPLFFMTDLAAISKINEDDIGIVEAKIDADWMCVGKRSAEEMGYDTTTGNVAYYLTQWSDGCQQALDSPSRHDSPVKTARKEYHSTLPSVFDPPDPADTIAYLDSMAELRVWNLKLIKDVSVLENLRNVVNSVGDAWDKLVPDSPVTSDPYWMPYHEDSVPWEFQAKVKNPPRRARGRPWHPK